tara:strand:+ start:196 stop:555 length:360 start_codon:yes stop_codon:yes gene_type:complete
MLKDIHKRLLLFIFGCMIVRTLLVVAAKKLNKKYIRYMGYILIFPAIGFFYIYFFNLRKTGGETFGKPIWWNSLRPIHGSLYLIFSYMAINNIDNAYLPLLLDMLIGLGFFINYHLSSI